MFYLHGRRTETVKKLFIINNPETEKSKDRPMIEELMKRQSLAPMVLIVFLFGIQSFCGSSMVNYYMVTVLQVKIRLTLQSYNHVSSCVTDREHSSG